MRGSFIRINNVLWFSNQSRDEGVGSNPGSVRKKQTKKKNKETPGTHDLDVARPP